MGPFGLESRFNADPRFGFQQIDSDFMGPNLLANSTN
jgi:hypothetical protein